jgi:hypothetical protein
MTRAGDREVTALLSSGSLEAAVTERLLSTSVRGWEMREPRFPTRAELAVLVDEAPVNWRLLLHRFRACSPLVQGAGSAEPPTPRERRGARRGGVLMEASEGIGKCAPLLRHWDDVHLIDDRKARGDEWDRAARVR